MKKILTVLIIGILIATSFVFVGSSDKSNFVSENETLNLSEPILKNKDDFNYVVLKQADTYLNNPGQPILPVINKVYKFPMGTIISDVKCSPKNVQSLSIENKIGFAKKPVIKDQLLSKNQFTQPDETVYESEKLYPSEWFSYNIGVGLDGEEHITYLTLRVYPVRYSAKNDNIKFSSSFDIKINYEKPKNTVETSEEEYKLVIISPRLFTLQLNRLAEHKQSHDISTKIVTTQEIYRDFEGVDKQEKIKKFIQHAVEEWQTTYVLLFGGMKGQKIWSWHVPVRYSNLDDASDIETSYVSDMYYSDLYKYSKETGYTFDDWDSNDNGIFAEWNTDAKDILDMYPDVCLGRIPCRYLFEVRKIVNRIIDYEENTKGQSWFNSMAVVGGDSFDDINWDTPTDYLEGQIENEKALEYMDGFEHTRIWVEGGDVEFTTENAENELSKGHGFVYFSGHGNPSSWSVHPHGDFETWISFGLKSIKSLTNAEKLPVLVVGGCHNCQFDVSILKILSYRALIWGEATTKCWGWQYASSNNGGSIATIGNTGLGYGTIGDGPSPPDEIPGSVPDGIPDCIQYLGGWLEPHFFEVYKNQSKDILGEAHIQSLIDYQNLFPINWSMNWDDHEQYPTLVDCKTTQQWVLFGDPSLKIGGY